MNDTPDFSRVSADRLGWIINPAQLPLIVGESRSASVAKSLDIRVKKALGRFLKAVDERKRIDGDDSLSDIGRQKAFEPTSAAFANQMAELAAGDIRSILREHLPADWDRLVVGAVWPSDPGQVFRIGREVDRLHSLPDNRLHALLSDGDPQAAKLVAFMGPLELQQINARMPSPRDSLKHHGGIEGLQRKGAVIADPRLERLAGQLKDVEAATRGIAKIVTSLRWRSERGRWDVEPYGDSSGVASSVIRTSRDVLGEEAA